MNKLIDLSCCDKHKLDIATGLVYSFYSMKLLKPNKRRYMYYYCNYKFHYLKLSTIQDMMAGISTDTIQIPRPIITKCDK